MPSWTKEQEEAIKKSGSNIIVSAGAGSGKTAVLSERVLYKLKMGIHINEFLILTFTRAAAEEMKDRIRRKIQGEKDLSEELSLIDSAYITTFDSFSLSIVKKYHYLLNIPKNIAITDESIIKIQKTKILDELFEKMYTNTNDDFLSFIDKYCVKDDKNVRNIILDLANKIENYLNKYEFLSNAKSKFFSDEFIDFILREYENLISKYKEEIELELANCGNAFSSDYIEKLEAVILPFLNCSDVDELVTYSKITLPAVPRGTDDECKRVKQNLKNSIDNTLNILKYGNRAQIRENILNSKKDIELIINILENYFFELENYKKEHGLYTFQDIANNALQILQNYDEVRNELKDSFKEIMIDEYQDTNDIQEYFISMIANDNVYMVGDIKQSIYRFRGSNPDIFKNKYDNFSKNMGGYKIDLIKNFRSRSEVLNNINDIFSLLMDSYIGGADYKVSHEMVYGLKLYDEEKNLSYDYDMSILEYSNEEDDNYVDIEREIFIIANDIKKHIESGFEVFDKNTGKLRKANYSDFVIILDRSKHFDLFKRIFEFLNIPLDILKDGKLTNSNDINIIKNIIDLIISIKERKFDTKFRYNFTSIARSFLYEYSDDYIYEIIKNNKYYETSIYKDFSCFEDYYSKTCTQIFMDILEITDFYNKIYKIGDYDDINVRLSKIYDLSVNLNDMSMSILDFRDYLEEIIEKNYDINYTAFSSGSESVKILTIHKSKGLEYPVCYFADINHKFNISDLNEKILCDTKFGFITPNSDNSDSIIKLLYKDKYYLEEISEKIRLFYVALTRAREKIVIVLPSKDDVKLEKNRDGVISEIRRLKMLKMSDFIYGIKAYYPKYFTFIDTKSINLSKDYLYNNIKKVNFDIENQEIFDVEEIKIEKQKIKNDSFSKKMHDVISKSEYNKLNFGTKMHEILEFIDFKNPNFDIIKDEKIQNRIKAFLNSDVLLNVKEASVYKEYEFTYEEGGIRYVGVIDLLLEYSDRIDIIDYKLKNIEDKNYIKQLAGYKNYIEKKTSKSVNTYLYSIIDETFKELDI